MQLMNFTQKFKSLTFAEWLTVILIAIAVTAVGFHIYESRRNIPYLEINSPMELNKTEYELGEVIKAVEVNGIRFRDSDPTVTRVLQCDNQKVSLRTIKPDDIITEAGKIAFTDIPVVPLSDAGLEFPERDELKPGTNCLIEFDSCDPYPLPLGGTRPLCARYFSSTFDILGPEGG